MLSWLKPENSRFVDTILKVCSNFSIVFTVTGWITLVLWCLIVVSVYAYSDSLYFFVLESLPEKFNLRYYYFHVFYPYGFFIGVGFLGISSLLKVYPEINILLPTIKSYEDIKELGLIQLAELPSFNRNDVLNREHYSSLGFVDSRSFYLESLRRVRNQIVNFNSKEKPKTLLISSFVSNEGKTTTAVNLSLLLASSEKKVLLIDCDLRKPNLHRTFNLYNTFGLTNCLVGDGEFEDRIIQDPYLPNLKVVTSGPMPPDPSALLSTKYMKAFLSYAKESFDFVILDTPPMLFSEVELLSSIVDSVILVVSPSTKSLHLKRAKEDIESIGGNILGVIVNRKSFLYSKEKQHNYGSSYFYGYYSEDDDDTPLMEDNSELLEEEDYYGYENDDDIADQEDEL